MSTDVPMFSVVVPAYNSGRFLPTALGSVYRQTVQDFEIVVVNDGSTDNTEEILNGERDPRLRVITRKNGGECVARNQGMREARGKYIAFLDSDDAWLPNHLEQALSFMESHPDIAWFSSTLKKVGDIAPGELASADCNRERIAVVNWYLEGAPLTLPSSVTVRREAIQKHPRLFAEGYKMFGDNIGWCIFAKEHPLVGISDTPTALYRYWEGNASSTNNVASHGVRSEAVEAALARHTELCREADCPLEARQYFRNFALLEWWPCISTAFLPEEWQADFTARKDVLGFGCTAWLRLWSVFHTLTLRAMRWGSRMCQLSVQRKMQRLAEKTRHRQN